MTRIKVLQRDELDEEQEALYREIEAADGRVRGGPYWAYTRNPAFMRLNHGMSKYFRDSSLSGRERQLAVLATVRHWGTRYPWAVQVRASLAEGIPLETAEAINRGETPKLGDPGEALAYRLAAELVGTKRLSEETYEAAVAHFGLERTVDLVAMVGFFSMTCLTASAFDIDPPEDAPSRIAE
jgi:4-carboxymuconolactone decarboxylase